MIAETRLPLCEASRLQELRAVNFVFAVARRARDSLGGGFPFPIHRVAPPRQPRSAQRDLGLRRAKSELIILRESDYSNRTLFGEKGTKKRERKLENVLEVRLRFDLRAETRETLRTRDRKSNEILR